MSGFYQRFLRVFGGLKKKFFNQNIKLKHNTYRPFSVSSDGECEVLVPPNKVYVWGSSRMGALGVLRNYEQLVTLKYVYPTPVELGLTENANVLDVTCGFGFTIYSLDTTNHLKLFGTGINDNFQIGFHSPDRNINETIFFPTLILLPYKNPATCLINKICAGIGHSMILTSEGLFILGNNFYGQCGRPIISKKDYTSVNYIHHITNIDGSDIKDIACGGDHSVIVTKNGSVYACGASNKGQTGLETYDIVPKFTRVGGDLALDNIISVSSRGDVTLALSVEGDVFIWGRNTFNGVKLVEKGAEIVNSPIYVKILSAVGPITKISVGNGFCMALNYKGQLFMWGGQNIGLGPNIKSSPVPLMLPNNAFNKDTESIKFMTAGNDYAAAINDKGHLFTWGKNKNYCLGIGKKPDQYSPVEVGIRNAFNVACGDDHTIALCKPQLPQECNIIFK